MKDFMNSFMGSNRNLELFSEKELREVFEKSTTLIHKSLRNRAFRPERALNAAVFDAVMVGTAELLKRQPKVTPARFKTRYDKLLNDPEFASATKTGTSGEANVKLRIARAVHILSGKA